VPDTLETLADAVRKHPKLVIADDFEIAIQKVESLSVDYADGALDNEERADRIWVSLRILHRKRGGRASVLNPHPSSIGQLVDSAFESANRGAVDPWFRFPVWKPTSPVDDETAEWGECPYASLRTELPSECGFLSESYGLEKTQTYLRRKSERREQRAAVQTHRVRFAVIAQARGSTATAYEERAQTHELEERGRWLHQLFQTALLRSGNWATTPIRGKRKTVLGPKVLSQLLQQIAPWFFADKVQAGRSPLSEKLNESWASPLVTLIDDGRRAGGVGTHPFDLEGVPAQSTVLIERGTVKSFLYDVYCATRENRLSTGNVHRSPDALQSKIQPTNFHFQAGASPREQLFREVGQGVFWDSLSQIEAVPGEPGAVYLRGSGWKIAYGELAEPLPSLEAVVGVSTLLRSAALVGSDLAFYGAYGSPSIFFEEMPLGI
jgi:PmbA protein